MGVRGLATFYGLRASRLAVRLAQALPPSYNNWPRTGALPPLPRIPNGLAGLVAPRAIPAVPGRTLRLPCVRLRSSLSLFYKRLPPL